MAPLERSDAQIACVAAALSSHAVPGAAPREDLDQFRQRDELEAAVDVLAQLPPRLRRIAFLRATGHRYREIQEITGDSRTRVSQLVRRANEHMANALEELEPTEGEPHPRAARLRQLETSPPTWRQREIRKP